MRLFCAFHGFHLALTDFNLAFNGSNGISKTLSHRSQALHTAKGKAPELHEKVRNREVAVAKVPEHYQMTDEEMDACPPLCPGPALLREPHDNPNQDLPVLWAPRPGGGRRSAGEVASNRKFRFLFSRRGTRSGADH